MTISTNHPDLYEFCHNQIIKPKPNPHCTYYQCTTDGNHTRCERIKNKKEFVKLKNKYPSYQYVTVCDSFKSFLARVID